MKKNSLIFILNMIILLGLFSCSDNDEIDRSNQIQLYGESYLLEKGAIYHDNNHTVIAINDYTFEDRYQGANGEQVDRISGFSAEVKEEQTGNFIIGLYEGGFIISDITNDARGSGACICLRIASPNPEKIVPGKYTYSLNHDEYTFKGYSSVNYSTNEDITPNELTEGEVYISQEGDTYTITFKCETSFGGPVEGSYTGLLKSIDIRKEYEILLNELRTFNPEMLDKQRVLAVTKCDMLDQELMDEIEPTLPENIPHVFISAISGMGISVLKDLLWEELNKESNKIEGKVESIAHRAKDMSHLKEELKEEGEDEDLNYEYIDDEDIEDLEDFEYEEEDWEEDGK